MEVRELRVFVTVCEVGSISAAARALHAGQSSVSETVQSLERQAGTELLVRSRNGVVPTPAGVRLLEAARSIVATHDGVLDELRAATPQPALRLGVPLEFSTSTLSTVSVRLAAADPALRLDLRPGSTAVQWEALRRGELDVALLRDRPYDDAYDSLLVTEEPMGVALSAALAGEVRGPVALEALSGLRWIGFPRAETPRWWDQVAALFRAHGIVVADPPEGSGPSYPDLKLAAAADGRSFALVPAALADRVPSDLVWRPLVDDPLVRRTWVVWRAASTRRDVAALVAAFE